MKQFVMSYVGSMSDVTEEINALLTNDDRLTVALIQFLESGSKYRVLVVFNINENNVVLNEETKRSRKNKKVEATEDSENKGE